MSTTARLPAYEITDAERQLVKELFKADHTELARDLGDYLLEKRWPDVPERVEPPNLVHLSDYRSTSEKPEEHTDGHHH
jgi:hypothetical protein